MVANTFTTEFSIAGAGSTSAARAVDACDANAIKLQRTPKPTNPSRCERVMFVYRILFTVDGEGEQGVSGIDVHRAVHDRRSAVIQGAAARFDPVLGLKIPGRIEVPQDLAVDGRICAQMPVHRSGECAARHDGDRLRLCMRAIAVSPTGRIGRGG